MRSAARRWRLHVAREPGRKSWGPRWIASVEKPVEGKIVRGKSQALDSQSVAAAASLILVDVAFVGWTPTGRAGVGALCLLAMLGTWAIFQRAEISDGRVRAGQKGSWRMRGHAQ